MNRGALTALRAAAIVVVATGLNEVIAGAVPRYEALYAYLAAIAIVVLLDGVILGACAAVLAVGFYALLFLPRATLLRDLPVPVIGAVLTVIVAAAVRGLVRARRRGQPVDVYPPSPQLLPSPPPPPPLDNTEVLVAIDDLRGELRDELRAAVAELSSAHEREEMLERTFIEAREALVTRLRIAEEEASAKDAELRRQLDAERAAFEVARSEALSLAAEEATLTTRVVELERAIAEREVALAKRDASLAERDAAVAGERSLVASLTTEAEQLRTTLEAARVSAAELAATQERRITTLNEDAERSRIALDAERTRALRLSAEIASERERLAELQAERTRERANVETARSEIEKLQRMLVTERAAVTARAAETDAARAETEELRKQLDEQRAARENADLESTRAREEAEREASKLRSALAAERTARENADLELTRVREEAEREASELRSALEAERAARENADLELTRVREEAEREASELRSALDAERTARENAELELTRVREEAEREASELRSALEAERAARENADLELTTRRDVGEQAVIELRTALGAERAARDDVERELASIRAQAKAAAEELETERGDAISRATDLATLRRELELERARWEGEKTLRERAEQDVAGAKADIALLESRLTELDAMRAATESELRAALESNKVEREKERAAFDASLHTIVTHLANDHEADLGKAVLEREEARAAARSANAKIGKLQQRIEEERQAILARLREADERHKTAIADGTHLLAETRAAAQKEIERLQLRIAELEQQQHAMQHAPQPHVSRGRVLIAHPDADMRATARTSLERAGYEIVTAADGLEALRLAIAQKPDVVIADAVMPKMNGRELCQLLKSQPKTAHIRVILLTRASDDLPKGDLPPDLLLRKPVPLEMLKTTLEELVTRT